MAKYRRRRNTLLSSGANMSDVPLIEIWFAIIGAIWWLGAALWKLWQLNPFSLIIERQRRLYYHDNRGALTIRPPWTERLGDMFRSDETRKAKLLAWVQDMVPRMPVDDFMSSWHDGLVLCCLLEEVCPGLCPRPELLKPHHRVNNCRLGIKLAQKYLHLPKMMITAEEMAIADKDTELKIIHLVQLIKWKYQRGPSSVPPSPMSQSRSPSPKVPLTIKVVARGTGLKAGIVGRRAKFNIFSDSASYLDLHIEIQGPNNEVNSERIVSIPHGINKKDARAAAGYPGGTDEDGRAKLIEDDVGNMFLRQKSIDEDVHQNVIPFDYQCVGEGRFLVTYIPRSSGPHFISIKSQDVDIEGSPFEVKVSDWMSSWNVMPKPRMMSFDMLPCIEEAPSRTCSSASESDSKSSVRGSKVRVEPAVKEPTVTKKRVLKKVIAPNGEEILLTPSPTLSRQSSTDISDLSEEDKKGKKDKYGSRKRSEKVYIRQKTQQQTGARSDFNKRAGLEEDKLPEPAGAGCSIKLSITSFEEDEDQTKAARAASMQELHRALSREKSRSLKELLAEQEAEEEEEEEDDTHYREEEQSKADQDATAAGGALPPYSAQAARREASGSRDSSAFLKGPARLPLLTSASPRAPHNSTSPSSSDEASAANYNRSETIDQESSPRLRDLSPDLHDNASPLFFGQAHDQEQARANENRRRFEKSLALRDQDADDSVETYSQLVSALTELRPPSVTPRKLVGRSFSDGETFGALKERHFIRLRRLDGQGGDCFWNSPSTDRDNTGHQGSCTSRNGLKTKVIQSDSLRKTCMYIEDRTITHSLSVNSSSPDRAPVEEPAEDAHDAPPAVPDTHIVRDDAATNSQRRQTLSSLKQQWKTFDADVLRMFEHGVATTGDRGHVKKLTRSRSCSETDVRQYNMAESLRLEHMSILDKLSEDDEILEVVIESSGQPEVERVLPEDVSHGCHAEWDATSEESSSSTSIKQTFEGSPSKQGNGVQRSPTTFARQNVKKKPASAEKAGKSRETEADSRVFRTIDKHKHKSREILPAPVSIIVPKAKATKATQVSYDEIKSETGWKRPAVRVHKRKKYINVTETQENGSPFDDTYHNGNNLPKKPNSDGRGDNGRPSCAQENEDTCEGSNDRSNTNRDSRVPPRNDLCLSDCDFKTWKDNSHNQNISRWIQQNEQIRHEQEHDVTDPDVKGRCNDSPPAWWGAHLQVSRDHSGGAVITMGQNYSHNKGTTTEIAFLGRDQGDGGVSSTERKMSTEEKKSDVDAPISPKRVELNTNRQLNARDQTRDKSTRSSSKTGADCDSTKPASPRTHSPFSRSRSEPFSMTAEKYSPYQEYEMSWDLCENLSYAAATHVLDWMQHAALSDHAWPERQSTVDTLDSGIENDGQHVHRYSSPQFGAHNGHRRLQRRPYPWAIELDPSLVRGSNSSLVQDESAGQHRRITRMAYPWEIELDPRLVRGSNSSLSTEGNQEDARMHLTLGVIEAAVHRTVCQILSGSSASTSSPRRRAPPLTSYSGTSFSDSELSYSDATFCQRRRMFRKARVHKNPSSARSGAFRKSTSVLSREPVTFSSRRRHQSHRNLDLTETKSDGRYSPYSVTDIPCFELPSSTDAYNQERLEGFAVSEPRFPRCNSIDAKDLSPQFSDNSYLAFMHHQQQQKRSLSQIFLEDGHGFLGSVGGNAHEDKGIFYVQSARKPDRLDYMQSPKSFSGTHGHRGGESQSQKVDALKTAGAELAGKETGRSVLRVPSKPSDSSTSMSKTGDICRPTIVIHRSPGRSEERGTSSTSTDDSYCGFGISRGQRKDLMGHLKCFQSLAVAKRTSCSPDSSVDGRSPGSVDDLPGKVSPDFLTHCSDPFDDNSLISPASSFVLGFFNEKDLAFLEGGDLIEDFASDLGTPSSEKNQRLGLQRHHGDDAIFSPVHAGTERVDNRRGAFSEGVSHSSSPAGRSDGGSAADQTGQCVAYGPGLSYGQVGNKNNFQVWAQQLGTGCVTVAVYGPRSHCVTETNVAYIGDNVYDVTFSVTTPGYYIIVVKWGNKSLPDSPFICKITY